MRRCLKIDRCFRIFCRLIAQTMTKDKELRRRHPKQIDHLPKEGKRLKAQTKQSSKQKWIQILVILAIIITVVGFVAYICYNMYLQERIRTPLDAPNIVSISTRDHPPVDSSSRFWGTYRSHTYFGLKARSPRSPVVGLMWLTEFTGQMPPGVRHWCDQGDGLSRYGWQKHDGVNFGVQEIEETLYTIKTDFVKRPGGQHGGDWSARISLSSKDPSKPVVVSLMFYIALDGQGYLEPAVTKKRLSSVSGQTEELGTFKLTFPKPNSSSGRKFNHLISYSSQLDRLKDVLTDGLKIEAWDQARKLPYYALGGRIVPRDSPGTNFIVHQVTAQVPFEMEVIFESGSFLDRPDTLSGDVFTSMLSNHIAKFDEKFSQKFALEKKGYTPEEIDRAKAALSNMIGSVGYFYGSSIVQSKYNKEPILYWEAPLYTGVPSRSFFPRGFLWDEGFHNLLISQWDTDISKDIISHWLDLLNIEGWIPREQILGVEARARVPAEFVVQRNENANPPTLFLPLQRIIADMVRSPTSSDTAFLKAVFPRLKAWYNWYNTTQVGVRSSTYRWRGRDAMTNRELNPKTLTSGLDDYPRSSHPTDDEYHVDLRCWMALASGLIADIAKSLGEDWSMYDATHRYLTDNPLLDTLHWSDKKQHYSDYGLHTFKVKLQKPKPPPNLAPGERPPQVDQEKIRVVSGEPTNQLVDFFGYVSLFPFLLKIVEPYNPKLFKILTDLKDPGLLWTDYGLRSLSKSAALYNRYNTEHDPPYWRGAIWINMNYLAVGALYHYANTPGPYQETAKVTYEELRNNLVQNILKEYQRTGFIWENYDDKTGQGRGSHPFTGWSALFVLMMAEKY